MALKEETREIDGKKYFARQWSAKLCLENQMKLISALGGASLPFIEGDFSFNAVLVMIGAGKPEVVLPLLREFVQAARVDGQEVNDGSFDFVYGGKLMTIYKVFAFVCEVNYKSFFEEGQILLQQEDPKKPASTKTDS